MPAHKVRLSVEIDETEHKYLKMCCAKLGVTIKDFVLESVINHVEEQEDKWWLEKPETQELLKRCKEGTLETIDFDEVLNECAANV